MSDPLKRLWVEKYRPNTIDELILPESYKEKFKEFIKNKNIPNLLLVGERGTGKTSVARILISSILNSKDDLLKINGSLENSIEIVRDVIMSFLKIPPIYSPIKIIHYEEFDYVSRAVQPALRDPMESMIKNCRFILTCNYEENLIEPIKSRCNVFRFSKLPKDKIKERLIFILNNENIEFSEKDLDTIIDRYYPSMRDMIQYLQKSSLNGKLILDDMGEDIDLILNKIIEFLNNSDFKSAMKELRVIDKELKTNYIDYNVLSSKLYENENIDFPIRAYFSALMSDFKHGNINHMLFIGVLFKTWTFSSKLN